MHYIQIETKKLYKLHKHIQSAVTYQYIHKSIETEIQYKMSL